MCQQEQWHRVMRAGAAPDDIAASKAAPLRPSRQRQLHSAAGLVHTLGQGVAWRALVTAFGPRAYRICGYSACWCDDLN